MSGELAVPDKLSQKQKDNVGVIAYELRLRNIAITPEEIFKAWPVDADYFTQHRAGKRPTALQISRYLGSDAGKSALLERGIAASVGEINGDDTLSPEQIALLSILSDPSLRGGLDYRLKKAGVKRAQFRMWRRQRAFAEAFSKIVSDELVYAKENVDMALIDLAVNDKNLNAIQYYNELLGRGPKSNNNVDAVKFSRVVLEAVMKYCTPEQLNSISAEIEIASKQAGLEIT